MATTVAARRHRRKNGGVCACDLRAASSWVSGGAGAVFVTPVGGFPVGPFFRRRGCDRRVHRQAPASGDDFLPDLDGLGKVASPQRGFGLFPGGDEEQPPKEDQQL